MENLSSDFLKLYQSSSSDRLTRYFHVPLQSGTPTTLLRMRRRYNLEEFTDKVADLHRIVPEGLIATDVIVGFIEESDADFEQTYRYLEQSPIAKAHIFKYSKREHTAGYYLAKHQLEPDARVKLKRSRALHSLFRKKLGVYQEGLLGQTQRALILRELETGYLAFLDNGLEIILPKSTKLAIGFRDVRIDKVQNGELFGKLAA